MKKNTPAPFFISCALAAVFCLSSGVAQEQPPLIPIPPVDQILKTLRKEHPRLLVTAVDFTRLKQRMDSNPLLKTWHAALQTRAAQMLVEPPSKYEMPDGLRLLDTSRRVLDRVLALSLLYRLDSDKRYADRVWQELEAAADFPDWNPRHFLDTAEMTCAFAIAYDWLYDFWTPEQRAKLRTAMVVKGITPAMKLEDTHGWWTVGHNNWTLVCNGGIGMGALALADVEPELSARFLHAALESVQPAMATYGPDGAWPEGPAYWSYATKYNVFLLSSLQTALGTDFGLTNIPGFSEAGTFPIYASGPTGISFDYADSHPGVIREASLLWLARQFKRPEFASYESRGSKGSPMDMLWYDPDMAARPAVPPPLDKYYRGTEIALMRSAWDDKDALFVGFKAGDNKAGHSHLDLGSFIIDALGVRWANDLGADDYTFPGYFGKQRWDYYRLRAEGHNTLVINPGAGPDQDPNAESKIIRFHSDAAGAFAIADLSAPYTGSTVKIHRGIAMLDRKQVLVQDEVRTLAPSELWWFLHTQADAQVGPDGTTAILTQGKLRMFARILSPANARFKIMKAEPLPNSAHPEHNGNNDKYRKLAIELQAMKEVRLAVLLTPLKEGEPEPAAAPRLRALDDWEDSH